MFSIYYQSSINISFFIEKIYNIKLKSASINSMISQEFKVGSLLVKCSLDQKSLKLAVRPQQILILHHQYETYEAQYTDQTIPLELKNVFCSKIQFWFTYIQKFKNSCFNLQKSKDSSQLPICFILHICQGIKPIEIKLYGKRQVLSKEFCYEKIIENYKALLNEKDKQIDLLKRQLKTKSDSPKNVSTENDTMKDDVNQNHAQKNKNQKNSEKQIIVDKKYSQKKSTSVRKQNKPKLIEIMQEEDDEQQDLVEKQRQNCQKSQQRIRQFIMQKQLDCQNLNQFPSQEKKSIKQNPQAHLTYFPFSNGLQRHYEQDVLQKIKILSQKSYRQVGRNAKSGNSQFGYVCVYCLKIFKQNKFMQNHYQRKHIEQIKGNKSNGKVSGKIMNKRSDKSSKDKFQVALTALTALTQCGDY